MFEFFRTYQRSFFIAISVVVIASLPFFGAYSAFEQGQEKAKEVVIGQAIDGTPILQSQVKALSRFLSTDRKESLRNRNLQPNFCNDGVISSDFLQTGLADLLVDRYLDPLKEELSVRVEKARQFRPYAHPDAPLFSAQAVWEKYSPVISQELSALQESQEGLVEGFSHLSALYLAQTDFQPELLRRLLLFQLQQSPQLRADQRLSFEDLSLFGFHSVADWFGPNFVDLISQFILNAAIAAEERGYQVSYEEAKGDLIHNFQQSMLQLEKAKNRPELSFSQHLRMLGFDEKTAVKTWQKVLLFRNYFQSVGQAAFVDRLPYKDFADYAQETVVLHQYEWPIPLKTSRDVAEFCFYLRAVCPSAKEGLPTAFLPVAEVEKKHPELVETLYRAKTAEFSKKQIGLRAPIKEVWEWQLDEKNFAALRKQFPQLSASRSREERFRALEKLEPKLRAKIDSFTRSALVDQNPIWVEEVLEAAVLMETAFAVPGDRDPMDHLQAKNDFVRVENLEKVGEKQILPFAKARPLIAAMMGNAIKEEKNPFLAASQVARVELQKNPNDPKWMKSGDLLLDQFKLERRLCEIQRNSKENWMKEEAFVMIPEQWSPIHVADDGQITFFYLQEKKINSSPILDQLAIGKETLAADAQRYVAERLIETAMQKQAITIPMQKEIVE